MWEKEKAGRIGVESYYTGTNVWRRTRIARESKPYSFLVSSPSTHSAGSNSFVNVENLTDVRQTRWNPLLRPAGPSMADGPSMRGRRWTAASSMAASFCLLVR